LRRTYPADFTLFLSSIVLALFYLPPSNPVAGILAASGLTAGMLLLAGWAVDSPRTTSNGAVLSFGIWVGQLIYLLYFGPGTMSGTAYAAFLLSAVGSANLALGVWLFTNGETKQWSTPRKQ
jgi:hypothetical protein